MCLAAVSDCSLKSGRLTAILDDRNVLAAAWKLAGGRFRPHRRSDVANEVELKFNVPPKEVPRLKRSKLLLKKRVGEPESERLVATYFDTERRHLAKQSISLRLRLQRGVLTQTVKISAQGQRAALSRREVDITLCTDIVTPDLTRFPEDVRELLFTVLGNEPLAPQVVTDVVRESWQLKDPKNCARIELAFDEGEVRAGTHAQPLHEIELELIEGEPKALYRLGLQLLGKHPLAHLGLSKIERGFALADRKKPKAVKGTDPHFAEETTIEEAYCSIVRACLSHLLANKTSVATGRLEEGLHQMRVALRRLRSALNAFRAPICAAYTRPLEEEAKLLARTLGYARDYDVFLSELLTPVEHVHPGEPGITALRAVVEGIRGTSWADVQELLASPRFARFLLTLENHLEERPWRRKFPRHFYASPMKPYAAEILERMYQSAAALGSRYDQLDTEDRHELRKRLKKLRYGFAFFESLFPPEKVARQLKDLSKMQDVLGALNDYAGAHEAVDHVVALEPRLAEAMGRNNVLPSLQTAGDMVLHFHQERADAKLARAAELWAAFAADERFWREALAG